MTYWKIVYGKKRKKQELTMLAESAEQAVYFAQLAFRNVKNIIAVTPLD